MAGFKYRKTLTGAIRDHSRNDIQLAASQSIQKGDALKLVSGKLTPASTTDVVDYIADETIASGATDIIKPAVIHAGHVETEWSCPITPIVDAQTLANAGTTTTAVVTLASVTSNQYAGGIIRLHETGEERVIASNDNTSDAVSGCVTFTVLEPFSRAPAVGDTVSLVGYGPGDKTVQLASTRTVSQAIAGLSSGKLSVSRVSLKDKLVFVTFNAS